MKYRGLPAILLVSAGVALVTALLQRGYGVAWTPLWAFVGACAGVGSTVVAGFFWALTPWGKRIHWEQVPGHGSLGPGLAGLGFAILSHHYHAVTRLYCEITGPDRSRVNVGQPVHLTGPNKMVAEPNDVLNELLGVQIFSSPGKYRFVWKICVEGRDRPITVARAVFKAQP